MKFLTSLRKSTRLPVNQTFFNTAPSKVLVKIFGYLSPEELARARRVSKLWNILTTQDPLWNAFDLKELFPKLSILSSQVWNDHVNLEMFGLSFTDGKPLDKRKTIPELKRLFAVLKVEGDAGITLLTIPKGLSFNKLVKIAGCPIKGNKATFEHIRISITAELGDVEVQKTYRVAITNNVLEGSRNKSFKDQQLLVEQFGCDRPKIIDVVALLILTFISSSAQSPLRLLNNKPWTLTRCDEKINNNPSIVGSFAPEGMLVSNIGNDSSSVGIVGWRKFD